MHKDFLNKKVAVHLRSSIWPVDIPNAISVLEGSITYSGHQGSFIIMDGTIFIPHDNIAAIFIIDDKEAT